MIAVPIRRFFLLLSLTLGLTCGAPICSQAVVSTTPSKTPPPLLLALPRTGQISTYDQIGNIINFQGSGQDGEFQRGTVWPDPRFIINRNGTVSDALTGLMWLKNGDCFGDLPWPSAVKVIAEFNQGKALCRDAESEYQDWVLPDLNQLASLIDAQQQVPIDQLKLAGFTNLQNTLYWTATAYRGQLNAWTVDFTNGSIDFRNKLDRHMLLLTRKEVIAGMTPNQSGLPPIPSKGDSDKQPVQSNQRFIDNTDGTVTDTMTGLMWLQDTSCLPKLDWQGALTAIKTLSGGQVSANCPPSIGQYLDWSLPNAIELKSLIDYRIDYPALPAQHLFTKIATDGYWTSTSVAAAPAQAFMINFNTGTMLPALKSEQHHLFAVRQIAPPIDRPRKESEKSSHLGVAAEYLLTLDPSMPSEMNWPPLPRFFNNGDGTSLDSITGIIWLTDANCFGKKKWEKAAETLQKFNAGRKGFSCADYEGGDNNWQLPTLLEMRELTHANKENSADWLLKQGIKNIQANTSYWTSTETPINLYFADAINLKTGKEGIYPKSLEFLIWPKKDLQQDEEQSPPLLHMTANAIDTVINITPQDPLSLAVYLHPFSMRIPADFWFWYDTPDEKRLWLTHIRNWTDKTTPVYQGPLFNLKNYEIYRSLPGLAPGAYEFHFAIDTIANGIFDEPLYETQSTVIINDK